MQELASHHVASCRVVLSHCHIYCEPANRDATQEGARIDSSSISASLALLPTNQISAKKHVRVLRALYRVRKG